jgi:hypothetical protein
MENVSFHLGLLPLTEMSLGILSLIEIFMKLIPKPELSFYGASSCESKTYKISIQRYSKDSLGNGFVKMSENCSFVPMYSTPMFFSTTYYRRK